MKTGKERTVRESDHLFGIPEERTSGREAQFEDVMAENFVELIKVANPQTHVQEIPNSKMKINPPMDHPI